MQVEADHEVNS